MHTVSASSLPAYAANADLLTVGVEAGMLIPDTADPTMKTVRVVAAPAGLS
nr:hypothetical protein [uncultured Actinoplanes sp.]